MTDFREGLTPSRITAPDLKVIAESGTTAPVCFVMESFIAVRI